MHFTDDGFFKQRLKAKVKAECHTEYNPAQPGSFLPVGGMSPHSPEEPLAVWWVLPGNETLGRAGWLGILSFFLSPIRMAKAEITSPSSGFLHNPPQNTKI